MSTNTTNQIPDSPFTAVEALPIEAYVNTLDATATASHGCYIVTIDGFFTRTYKSINTGVRSPEDHAILLTRQDLAIELADAAGVPALIAARHRATAKAEGLNTPEGQRLRYLTD